ncbi:MAG: sigma-54-dependent Fis family transcriptional regulator [Desulfobacterium sp.]|nr:sigma-54-dependent Fis family transcriptional regulator [Desulfobacterium sp.]
MANVLIIDDDRVFCDVLSRRVSRLGHHSAFALTLSHGEEMANQREFDVIMLDVQLPDGNGIEAIPRFQALAHSPEVIIITGSGSPDGAELAIKWGAWDYVQKPASVEAITLPLLRALEFRKEKNQARSRLSLKRKEIIGSSPQLVSCLELVGQAAQTDVSILIQGETGTGKELLARAIHDNSSRSKGAFIVVDCGAIPENLVEGLLYGHEKGVFTGADKKQIGLIEQANQGTLFLDEIGELPLAIQTAFLRVLQEHRYRPLGSTKEKESDFRLVSASNRDMEKRVKEGHFREDLLYRIRAFSIISPPLRERLNDISELSMYYVTKKCETSGILTKGFSPDFFEAINAYDWPGNIRDLFNTLDSAMVSAGEQPILFPQHLPVKIRSQIARTSASTTQAVPGPVQDNPGMQNVETNLSASYKDFKDQLLTTGEKHYFTEICTQAKGNPAQACIRSGLSKSRLYHFLQKHGISLADYK